MKRKHSVFSASPFRSHNCSQIDSTFASERYDINDVVAADQTTAVVDEPYKATAVYHLGEQRRRVAYDRGSRFDEIVEGGKASDGGAT